MKYAIFSYWFLACFLIGYICASYWDSLKKSRDGITRFDRLAGVTLLSFIVIWMLIIILTGL